MRDALDRLLRGAIDTHVHTAPDVVPRKTDDLELARAASAVEMAAIVLKCHHAPTASRATIAARYAGPVRVFGGVALNTAATGGLNVDPVRAAVRMGGKIVWMPTFSAANHKRFVKQAQADHVGRLNVGFAADEGIGVLDDRGQLRLEVDPILDEIAAADIILATGHLSVEETKVLVRRARERGVKRILITHPELPVVAMSVEDQQELANVGVFFERCVRSATRPNGPGLEAGVRQIAEQIQAVGVQSTVLATDYGQPESPTAPDGLRNFVQQLIACGLTEPELNRMVKDNPARLLGL